MGQVASLVSGHIQCVLAGSRCLDVNKLHPELDLTVKLYLGSTWVHTAILIVMVKEKMALGKL